MTAIYQLIKESNSGQLDRRPQPINPVIPRKVIYKLVLFFVVTYANLQLVLKKFNLKFSQDFLVFKY
jgi:hypothetical protein